VEKVRAKAKMILKARVNHHPKAKIHPRAKMLPRAKMIPKAKEIRAHTAKENRRANTHSHRTNQTEETTPEILALKT